MHPAQVRVRVIVGSFWREGGHNRAALAVGGHCQIGVQQQSEAQARKQVVKIYSL
jgi:hypothetical protein